MSIMELGALGEFFGVFALVATLIYLAVQVRQARSESDQAVLEARTAGIRELNLTQASSDGLVAAIVKAEEALGAAPRPFEAALMSHGLAREEARRVTTFYVAGWVLDQTQYATANQEQRHDQDLRLRAVYPLGVGRLFWDHVGKRASNAFTDRVNRLIAEVDQEAQQ